MHVISIYIVGLISIYEHSNILLNSPFHPKFTVANALEEEINSYLFSAGNHLNRVHRKYFCTHEIEVDGLDWGWEEGFVFSCTPEILIPSLFVKFQF